MKKSFKRKLTLAVALYLSVACPTAVYASSTSEISYNGKDMFKVYYYGEEDVENLYAESIFSAMTGSANEALCYTLKDDIKAGLDYAFEEWAEIIGPRARNKKPLEYFVGTNDVQNASATSDSFSYGKQTFNPHYLRAALQDGTEITQLGGIEGLDLRVVGNYPATGYGRIIIGQNISPDKGDGRYGFSAMPPLLCTMR